jgi:hypothetical protein
MPDAGAGTFATVVMAENLTYSAAAGVAAGVVVGVARSTRAPQNLNSGIFPTGSRAGFVSIFAGDSA